MIFEVDTLVSNPQDWRRPLRGTLLLDEYANMAGEVGLDTVGEILACPRWTLLTVFLADAEKIMEHALTQHFMTPEASVFTTHKAAMFEWTTSQIPPFPAFAPYEECGCTVALLPLYGVDGIFAQHAPHTCKEWERDTPLYYLTEAMKW